MGHPVFGVNIYIVKKNAEALIVASKESGREVNGDKTKYMVMSRGQNAGRGHNMKTDNASFEKVEEFKYLGTTLTNQNSIQEEIKNVLKSRNATYHLSFVFNFVIQKYKDEVIQNYNFAYCFIWVRNLVAQAEGGT